MPQTVLSQVIGAGRWQVRALVGLLVLAAVSLGLPAGGERGPTGRAGLAEETAADAGATPDCGLPPADPFPVLQRARHLAGLGVDRWHALGHRGRGVKVAVLDSGFRGYRDHLGKALPATVRTRSFRDDGNLEAKDSQHGILCGEVIHALAPEAELLFANWEPDRSDRFLDAVRWARREGARIVSCSLIMPSWSDGEGNGPVHKALADILGSGNGAGDMLCFACAGNTAQRHWTGTFRGGPDGYHQWEPGQTDNRLYPWDDERVSVELCARPGAGYQLSVHDTTGGEEVGRAAVTPRADRCCAVVRFLPERFRTYAVRVRLMRGEASPFHLVVLGGGLRHATAHGSIPFPGDGPEVIAVGAVDRDERRLSYSSCGPNSNRPKPDLVAVVPFPSLWRSRPFAGTSSAAPQAAGLAALLWSRYPHWNANEVRQALTTWARDLGTPGHDWETGHGLIRLP